MLIFEPHPYHYDELTSISYCFDLLGYEISILTQKNCKYSDVFCCCYFADKIKFMHYEPTDMVRILKSKRLLEYEFVFFTSLDYFHDEKKERLLDFLGFIPNAKRGILGIYHNMNLVTDDDIELIKAGRIFGLSPCEYKGYKIKEFSPSYFGYMAPQKRDNKKTYKAVMVGGSNHRRMAEYSYMKLKKCERKCLCLENIGRTNATLEIYNRIGCMLIDSIEKVTCKNERFHQASLIGWIRVKRHGFVDFAKLYSLINDSDFILIAMDPNIASYREFLNGKTSGAKLLSLGFHKPCIIQEEFAKAFGFNEENSLIFRGSLEEAFRRICNMSQDEYKKMCKNIEILSKDIFELSFSNLRTAVETL